MNFESINRSFLVKSGYFIINIFFLNTIIILGTIASFGLLFIPLTVGALYLFRKIVFNKPYKFWTDFYQGFKMNLKESILLSFVFLILLYLLWVNLQNQANVLNNILAGIEIYGLFLIWIYGSGIIARFNVGLRSVLKFSFVLGNSHLLSTISMFLIGLVIGSLYYLLNFMAFFIIIAFYLFIVSFILFKVLRRYEPK